MELKREELVWARISLNSFYMVKNNNPDPSLVISHKVSRMTNDVSPCTNCLFLPCVYSWLQWWPKLVQIGPKSDKSGNFQDQFSVPLGSLICPIWGQPRHPCSMSPLAVFAVSPAMSGVAPNWVRLASNGTNLGLLKLSFSTFWLTGSKCSEINL